MGSRFIFDEPHYDALNTAREATLHQLLESLRNDLELHTAVDVGCGLGHFAALLGEMGFRVVGVDARAENAAEAKRRHPTIEFRVQNAEDPEICTLGSFDFSLCFGLLYHLENPLLALRNVCALTKRVVFLETVVAPMEPPVLALCDEAQFEDQGLSYAGFYPSEACVVKMLCRAGFRAVYRLSRMPNHQDFRASLRKHRARILVVASHVPLEAPFLVLVREPIRPADLWATRIATFEQTLARGWNFLWKPWPGKMETLRRILRGG